MQSNHARKRRAMHALAGARRLLGTLGRNLTPASVTSTGGSDTRVSGTVFEVTDAELAAADQYEQLAAYKRVAIVLASGKQAWVYVDARSAPKAGTP